MNQPLTISMITNRALFDLVNNLGAAKHINRQYSKEFAIKGAKIGNTVNVRMPARYVVTDGPVMVTQDFVEEQVAVRLDHHKHVAMSFSSEELLLSIDEFSDRVIRPAAAALANQIDADVLGLYKKVASFVGVPQTIPADAITYLNAGVELDNNATPIDGERYMVINPRMQAKAVDTLKGLFQSSERIKEQYEKGRMGTGLGFEFVMDQNTRVHTIGAIAGTPTVNGANQTGSSLLTQAWGALATLKEGDIIQLANSYQVNPQNRESTGTLQPFRVTADTAADGAGAMTIPIWPAITTAGARQTVTNSPASGALISVFGVAAANFATIASKQTPQGLAFHKNAFTLAAADLPLPEGVDKAARPALPEVGLSLTLIRDFDISSYQWPCRLDVLYGVQALRPELACRVCS